jgi:hypothetical protein
MTRFMLLLTCVTFLTSAIEANAQTAVHPSLRINHYSGNDDQTASDHVGTYIIGRPLYINQNTSVTDDVLAIDSVNVAGSGSDYHASYVGGANVDVYIPVGTSVALAQGVTSIAIVGSLTVPTGCYAYTWFGDIADSKAAYEVLESEEIDAEDPVLNMEFTFQLEGDQICGFNETVTLRNIDNNSTNTGGSWVQATGGWQGWTVTGRLEQYDGTVITVNDSFTSADAAPTYTAQRRIPIGHRYQVLSNCTNNSMPGGWGPGAYSMITGLSGTSAAWVSEGP